MPCLALEFGAHRLVPRRGRLRLGWTPLGRSRDRTHAHASTDQHRDAAAYRIQHRGIGRIRDCRGEHGTKRVGREGNIGHRRTRVLRVLALTVRKPPRLVDVDDNVVDLRMLRATAHEVRHDLLGLAERPIVNRIVHSMEGPSRVDLGCEIRRECHQWHPSSIRDISHEFGLTTRIGQEDRTQTARTSRRAEHLELLDPVAVVINANGTVGTTQRIERLV